jgi:hypothetical protein
VKRAGAFVLLAALVAGCGSPAAIPQPTQAGARSLPTPTITARPGLVANAELKDKRGDVHGGEGRDAPRTPRVDIVKVTAAADGDHIRVALYFAGDVPKTLSSFEEEITYGIDMTVNDSGNVDYSVTVGNLEGGNWDARLTPWFDTAAIEYLHPIVDGLVGFVVPLSSIGSPTAIRLRVIAERVDHADGSLLAEDHTSWLTLALSDR